MATRQKPYGPKPMAVDPEIAKRVESMVKLPSEGVQIDLDYFIREVIQQAMVAAYGRQVKAGEMLGMSVSQIKYAIDRYSINTRHGRPVSMRAPVRKVEPEVPRIITSPKGE